MATLLIENYQTLLVQVLAERYPTADVLKEELRHIRLEMASAQFDAQRAWLSELSTAMRYEVWRPTSLIVFTAKQLASAERMIRERGETRRPIGD